MRLLHGKYSLVDDEGVGRLISARPDGVTYFPGGVVFGTLPTQSFMLSLV